MPVNTRDILSVAALTGLFAAVTVAAQGPAATKAPAAAAAKPPAAAAAPATPGLTITATSANVSGAGEKVEFYINRWSTDDDRDKLSAAWNTKPAPPPAAGARAGAEGAQAARGGGGGNRGRGAANAPAAPRTPEAALAAALKELTPAGYFWTSEVGGYVIRYAAKMPGAAAGESRIVMLTDKRLGAAKNTWQPAPAGGTPNNYEFSLIELRVPGKGEGEGKASLVGTVTLDPATKTMTLEQYDAQPVTLRGVKVSAES